MILGVVVAVDAEPRVVEHAPLAWVILARDVDTGLFVEPPRRKAQLVRDGARSSPVSEACHAAAAATARRSKYSRIASATNADRLLPATAALSSAPSSSSSVIEMLTVTSEILPTTMPTVGSLIRSACRPATKIAVSGTKVPCRVTFVPLIAIIAASNQISLVWWRRRGHRRAGVRRDRVHQRSGRHRAAVGRVGRQTRSRHSPALTRAIRQSRRRHNWVRRRPASAETVHVQKDRSWLSCVSRRPP